MPELPEVETTRRGIAPALQGRHLIGAVVRDARLRWPVPPDLPVLLRHVPVLAVRRRAKYLLLDLPAATLLIHLGMSGNLRILPADTPPAKHDHVDLLLDNATLLRLRDPRRFGAILHTDQPPEQHPLLRHLGPEPLSADFEGDYLWQATRRRSLALKLAVMNPALVVGVGNIYASEALFRAGLNPFMPAQSLTQAQAHRLVATIRTVLEEAITQGGSTLRDYVGGDGASGYFQLVHQVYGRTGEPCRVCLTPIQHARQGQRSTFYCPRCQQIPA